VLREDERQRITQALGTWLEGHPEPDEPVFRIARAAGDLTPRQVFRSVAERDQLGEEILAILEYSIRRTSLEEVASNLEDVDTEPPPAATAGTPVHA
jgi:hypothetical protein